VIRSFKHKGLAKFFETGSKGGIESAHADRLRLILGRLNAAAKAEDMELTRFRGHIILWPQGVHEAENTSPVFP